jgi:rhodanese-related sulfurtransferase
MSVKDIDAKTAQAWFEADKAVLVDVREPAEYAREHITGARLVPLSAFDREDFSKDHDKAAIFHCRSGARTAAHAERLLRTGFREVYALRGGLMAWKQAGLPVHDQRRSKPARPPRGKAPISPMRQVQMLIGPLILLGALLGAFVSPWYLLICGVIGAGVLNAGFTGVCPMERVLALMPWNRGHAAGSGGAQPEAG